MTDILQKTYHKLQEWILILNADWGKNTDAELVRQEMMEHCGEIWNSRDCSSNLNKTNGGETDGKKTN